MTSRQPLDAAEIARLTAELHVSRLATTMETARADKAEADRDAALALLKTAYGRIVHESHCAVASATLLAKDRRCNCGAAALLEKIDAALKEQL